MSSLRLPAAVCSPRFPARPNASAIRVQFIARRKALGQALGSGTVLMFGSTMPLNGIRFRQDNDFYYLTGNADVNAVLVMDAATADAWLFLPEQGAREIRSDGKNWLSQGDQAKAWGFAGIQPLTELTEFLERRRGGFGSRCCGRACPNATK